MDTFFILSLPRSRTAWLANFLTYENSYCFHEGMLSVSAPYRLKELFESTGKPVVGNSDCGNIFFIDEIQAEFPDAGFIIVERNIHDVLAELGKLGTFFSNVESVVHASSLLLKFKQDNPDTLVVDFDDLNKKVCRDIWVNCVGTHFDATRWEMLDGLDIQIILEKKINQIKRHESNIINMLGELH